MEWPRFKECITWKFGRGNRIKFWLDDWLEGGCLMIWFPSIFAIAQSKEMVIEEACRKTSTASPIGW